VIYEGRELLEFGDSFVDAPDEAYVFEDPEYADLVEEFLGKNKYLEDGEYCVVSSLENPRILELMKEKGGKQKIGDISQYLDSGNDGELVVEKNKTVDKSSMRFDMILNMKQ
jgi:hypothetical protein